MEGAMLTEKQLAEIEKLEQAATPWPWSGLQYFWGIKGADKNLVVRDMGAGRNAKENQANQDFIAHAREDVPALLHDVRRLRAVVEQYADRTRWVPGYYSGGVLTGRDDLWVEYSHGYTIAEECLKDGE